MTSLNARLPSVDTLLRDAAAIPLIKRYGRKSVTEAIRVELKALRTTLQSCRGETLSVESVDVLDRVTGRLQRDAEPTLKRVFNMTGTVIHTNLGRSSLPAVAAQAMFDAAVAPANLEFDTNRGRRGDRDSHVDGLICELTGAEAATVVNNNAAAVLLVLSTLAKRKEVPVSRGELIEIGGAFRMPDIMASAGTKLVEVGTTNRTHARDYETAIGSKTALIMKVHMANYRIEGFTSEVGERDLAALAHRFDLPFVVDLGSGTLADFTALGLPHEPTPAEALANGADLVTFSGDKLLGGPQAGIICGRADLIAKLKKSPMKRALRLDKVTLAGLAAVLRLYRDPDRIGETVPSLRLLTRAADDIRAQAERLLPQVRAALSGIADITAIASKCQVGSGSLPVDKLDSTAFALVPLTEKRRIGKALDDLAQRFRGLPVPVVGRISEGALMFDLRCLDTADEAEFVAQLGAIRAPS